MDNAIHWINCVGCYVRFVDLELLDSGLNVILCYPAALEGRLNKPSNLRQSLSRFV